MSFLKWFAIADKSYISALSRAGSIGLHMVSGIAVGAIIGYSLDEWLGTSPKCTAIFLIVGIIAGFKNVYVDAKRLIATQKAEEEHADKQKSKASNR